jgi:hypothetical protein
MEPASRVPVYKAFAIASEAAMWAEENEEFLVKN